MPPKTKGRKTSKESNENKINSKSELKATYETRKTRRALADKTNSDDSSAMTKDKKKGSKAAPRFETKGEVNNNNERPRRNRRLPPRFNENHVLKNLSNSLIISPEKNVKNYEEATLVPKIIKTAKNTNSSILSANSTKSIALKKGPVKIVKFKTPIKKTPQKTLAINQNPILNPRPHRVCHLPSKFEDHSVSPSKFIPVQPCFASTPIVNKSTAKKNNETVKKSGKNAKCVPPKISVNEEISPIKSPKAKKSISKTSSSQKKTNNVQDDKVTDNKIRKAKSVKTQSPTKIAQNPKERKIAIANKSMSYRLLDDNIKDKKDNADVYEFIYDPNEEPPPQKKKRKKPATTKRKPTKPKLVVFKNTYDVNVAKSIQDLKDIVTKKTQLGVHELTKNNPEIETNITDKATCKKNVQQILTEKKSVINAGNNLINPSSSVTTTELETIVPNNDDIPELNCHDNLINYSPVNSPYHATSPILNSPSKTSLRPEKPSPRQNRDPLNLQEEDSFFDDLPIASSSINTSVRHPHASPWRVDFQNLPLKWHPNSYVKPNMTPAIESSFINNFDEPKKKHVYTNIVPILTEPLPELHQDEPSKLVQPSIISYIREVAEKSANKKKREKSATPNIYDIISSETGFKQKTPKKLVTPIKGTNCEAVTPKKNASVEFDSNSSADSNENANLKENRKRKSDKEENTSTSKTPRKEKDANNTFFGFDDSENQENIFPVKKVDQRVRALRPRARAVLQEINNQNGPMRAVLPVKTKSAPSSENENIFNEELKSAVDAPVLRNKESVNVNSDINQDSDGDESNSVHLFEDIDVVHHLKPTRKSYGKSKKVAFKQDSTSDDESSYPEQEQISSDDEDLSDLTFKMPSTKSKKTNKKKQDKKKKISKKEEAEAEAWAANFNSMCEDVEKCPLVVE